MEELSMDMIETAETIGLEGKVLFRLPIENGIPVYAYGAVIALAALACFVMLIIRSRKIGRDTAALAGCLMAVLGTVLSRLVYCFATESFLSAFAFSNLYAVSLGGFSMYGALGGMVLGAWLASKAGRKKTGDMLDALAPCLMLFVLIARCGEWNSNLGISRQLTEERGNAWLFGTVFAYTEDGYFYYLRTYLFEIATALILFVVLLASGKATEKKSGNLFLRFMILFGATQVIWEALRSDHHMKFNFVGVQHIMSYTLLTIAIVILAVRSIRSGKKGTAVLALSLILPVAGAAVGLEFLLDRSNISRYLLYAIYAVMMASMAVLGLTLEKQSRTETAITENID